MISVYLVRDEDTDEYASMQHKGSYGPIDEATIFRSRANAEKAVRDAHRSIEALIANGVPKQRRPNLAAVPFLVVEATEDGKKIL